MTQTSNEDVRPSFGAGRKVNAGESKAKKCESRTMEKYDETIF